jgi:hypothetical protein
LYPEGVLQHVTSDKSTTRGAKPALKMKHKKRQAWRSDFERAIKAIEKLLEPPPTIDETKT